MQYAAKQQISCPAKIIRNSSMWFFHVDAENLIVMWNGSNFIFRRSDRKFPEVTEYFLFPLLLLYLVVDIAKGDEDI